MHRAEPVSDALSCLQLLFNKCAEARQDLIHTQGMRGTGGTYLLCMSG